MVWENILKDDSPLNRSMQLFQIMASEWGINRIEMDSPYSVKFEYKGLYYTMTPEGLYIEAGERYIYVCVVDKKGLPLGDYYASLMGLIVNDPGKIPTLNFGIKLAGILNYSGKPIPYEMIKLFTPFGSEEDDETSYHFRELIYALKRGPGGHYTLAAIEKALIESFGDTRGFF